MKIWKPPTEYKKLKAKKAKRPKKAKAPKEKKPKTHKRQLGNRFLNGTLVKIIDKEHAGYGMMGVVVRSAVLRGKHMLWLDDNDDGMWDMSATKGQCKIVQAIE